MPTLTTISKWTISASDDVAHISHTPVAEYWAPRVWSGRGLAIAETELADFQKAVGEVMKLPVYWLARARCPSREAGDATTWSEPRHDPDDEFVYLSGPCRAS